MRVLTSRDSEFPKITSTVHKNLLTLFKILRNAKSTF